VLSHPNQPCQPSLTPFVPIRLPLSL
jgi:hypothetical protein